MTADPMQRAPRYAAIAETSTEGSRWYIWKDGYGINYVGGKIASENDAKAIAAELNALLTREEDGWRPIETAPRDGRWLLVYGNVWAGEISGIARNDKGDVSISRYSDGKSDFPGEWWEDAGGDAYATWCQPTHWRPLPPAPEGRG